MVVIAPNIYAVTAWAGCLPKFATARPALAAVACWLVAVSCAKLKVLIRCYENIEYSDSVANSVYQLVTPTSPARKKNNNYQCILQQECKSHQFTLIQQTLKGCMYLCSLMASTAFDADCTASSNRSTSCSSVPELHR